MSWAVFGVGVAVGFMGAIGVAVVVAAGLCVYVVLTDDRY